MESKDIISSVCFKLKKMEIYYHSLVKVLLSDNQLQNFSFKHIKCQEH